MQIDFTTTLVSLDGKPLITEQGAPPMTLGDVSANALLMQHGDENPPGAEKVKRWSLALRLHKAKDAELAAEDVTTLKDLIAKAYAPLVVGQAWSILDPISVK